MPDEQNKLKEFLEAGTEIAGGAAGAAVGLLIAGPTGAVAGGAIGPALTRTFKHTCLEMYDRISGRREKIRAGAAAYYALEVIKDRILRGGGV